MNEHKIADLVLLTGSTDPSKVHDFVLVFLNILIYTINLNSGVCCAEVIKSVHIICILNNSR